MDSSGTPLKPTGLEQHTKLSAKFFELAPSPLRKHFACEAETEQSSKNFALILDRFLAAVEAADDSLDQMLADY